MLGQGLCRDPTDAGEMMADLGEHATFIELKDCGHSPLIDDLDQLLKVLEEIL